MRPLRRPGALVCPASPVCIARRCSPEGRLAGRLAVLAGDYGARVHISRRALLKITVRRADKTGEAVWRRVSLKCITYENTG
jgi:hypothetical protein